MTFEYKGPCGFTHSLFLLTVGASLFVNQSEYEHNLFQQQSDCSNGPTCSKKFSGFPMYIGTNI